MRTAYREDIVRSRTTAGRKDVSTVDTIDQVREGMTVVDMTGERVGTVSAVSIGDPQAVTDQGQHVAAPQPACVAPHMHHAQQPAYAPRARPWRGTALAP